MRSDDLPVIDKPSHPLRSASELDYPPFSIVRGDGAADGFSVDLLTAVAAAVDRGVTFEVGPWSKIKQRLIDGELDVLPLVSHSRERDRQMDFSAPYLRMHGTILVRRGNQTIRTEKDLKGREVLVMRGDTAHEYALRRRLTEKLILTDTFEEAIQRLSQGRHDAVIIQQVVGMQLLRQLGITNVVDVGALREDNFKPAARPLSGFEQNFCFAVPEGEKELLWQLNEGLAIVMTDGTYQRLYEKWFRPILPPPEVRAATIAKYVGLILVPILFCAGGFGIWYMRREIIRKTENLREKTRELAVANNRLVESESRLLTSQKIARLGHWDWDVDTGRLTWSEETCRIFGQDPETFTPDVHAFEAAIHPDDLDWFLDERDRAVQEKRGVDIEHRIIRPDGGIRHVRELSEVIFDPDGNQIRVIGTVQDITDRKQAEAEVISQRRRAQRYLNLAGVMVIGLDADGRINLANQKACRILGCRESELMGCNWFDHFIPEGQREAMRRVFQQLISGSIEQAEYHENEILTRSGEKRTIAWHNNYLANDRGRIEGVVASGQDITEKRQLEAQLQQFQKMESLGNLAGGIAHDFNNILFPIIGMAELLTEDLPPGSPEREHAREILTAGKRGGALVRQILAFSRQTEEQLIPLRVQQPVKEALTLCRSTIPASIEIREEIQPDCGLILGDQTQIHQVVMNLITNAYHAVDTARGEITVQLSEEQVETVMGVHHALLPGRYVRLRVRDNGCGMPPTVAKSIFEPYFSTKENGKGTGLGLAVVHGIVKACGGEIAVSSEPGRGTTFDVYFPLRPRSAGRSAEEGLEAVPGGTETILLVDDEPAIIKLESTMLERLGYRVTSMTSSLEALDLFQTAVAQFDLVITDMAMPKLPGDRLAEEMLAIRPDLPVVLCTGFSEGITPERAQTIGIRDILLKPVVKSEMARVVRRVLDESRNAEVEQALA